MENKNKKPGDPGAFSADRSSQTMGSSQDGFNNWLERKLHQMFDDVAAQPLPENLKNLLTRLDEKEREKK